jgi:signal transduction histidine kinase
MNGPRPLQLVTLYDRLVVEETVSLLRHDLRNKIAAVRNAAFYLRRKLESPPAPVWSSDPRMPQMADVIQSELSAMDALVTSRSAVSRSEETTATHASAAVDELLATVGPGFAARIDVVKTDDAAVMLAPLELQLAIYCLLENAVEARAEGRVALSIRRREDARLAIEVSDEGPGFVGDAAMRHLEPFFTTHPGRVGLGLNIARRLAYRGEGGLEVAGLERGVSATLVLPSA